MNLKKGTGCLFILTFVMCFTIYQIRDGEKEEVRSQYEQDKSHKMIALEEKISKLQNQITSPLVLILQMLLLVLVLGQYLGSV
jgi:hypothetical protein